MVSMSYDNVSPLLYTDFLNDVPTDLSIVLKWVIRRPFLLFLSSRTLRVMNHKYLPNCSATIIRLVYKAQDLGLDMHFPQEELRDMCFERPISNGCMQKYYALHPPFRQIIDRNFVIPHQVNDDSKLSNKEKENIFHYLIPRDFETNHAAEERTMKRQYRAADFETNPAAEESAH